MTASGDVRLRARGRWGDRLPGCTITCTRPPVRMTRGRTEGKGVITDIDRLRGEEAPMTRTETLDAGGLGVRKALFSDDPFPLPSE